MTDINLTVMASAGAMTGNTHALVNLIHDFFNEKILSPEQTQTMKQTGFVQLGTGIPVPPSNLKSECVKQACYGLGIVYFYDARWGSVYTYTGGTFGYNTTYVWLPDYNAVIGITINSQLAAIGEAKGTTLSNVINQVVNYLSDEPRITKHSLPENLFNAEFKTQK